MVPSFELPELAILLTATPSIWKLFEPGSTPLALISCVPLPSDVALSTLALVPARKAQNLGVVAVGHGQGGNLGSGNGGSEGRVLGLKCLDVGFYRDGLADGADLQRLVRCSGLGGVHSDRGNRGGLEASGTELQADSCRAARGRICNRQPVPVVAVRV